MKKFKRPIVAILILAIISTMFIPMLANAATVTETKLNIRTSTKYKYMNNWAYPNSRNGIHLATVAEGQYKGEPAYCIEFGKDMGEDGQNETIMDIDKVPAWEHFNASQKSGVTRATIYGYPNFNYGVSDEAAQVATQFVVWEYTQGYRTSADGDNPIAGLNGTSEKIESAIAAAGFDVRQQYYMSGVTEYSDVETAYKGILNGIKNHRMIPSFNSNTIELKWNAANKRYEAVITDNNKVLSYYNLSSENTNLAFSLSGNTLTIYTKSAISGTNSVSMTKTCAKVGADIGFVPENQNYNQSLVGRLTDPVTATFKVKTAAGNAKIIKTSEDGKVDGIKFSISGNGLTYTGITNSKGEIFEKNIPAGIYTVTEQSIDKYVPQKSQTITVGNGNETATVTFKNVLKKFRVTVTKSDAETDVKQGNASLAGAIYGIYKGDILVDRYTTDSEGAFTTKYYNCDTDWSVKEISPSEGYLLDPTVYPVGADPKLYTLELNDTAVDAVEQIKKGDIALVKHTDNGETGIETPESGAEFQIYLKSSDSFDASVETERDTITCDENGFAQSKKMPYGVYTVHQTKGWDGREMIDDFDVFISQDGQTYHYILNNRNFASYIKIVKTDAESGKIIPYAGAGFQLFRPDGTQITQTFTYPEVTVIDTFYTTADGMLITPEKLEYGTGYSLIEVEAPYGYVLNSDPVYFDVTEENSSEESGITIIQVEKPNMAQEGVIKVNKTGEVLSGVTESDGIYQPIYTEQGLPGAVYTITAKEDIYTLDGTLRYSAGDVVDILETDETGNAVSKELYLGKFLVTETQAPYGMVLSKENVHEVELIYAGQAVSVTETGTEFYNERQKAMVSIQKILEKDEIFGIGMNGEIRSVKFGLYAAEDIVAADGTIIPADGLMEIISVSEEGLGVCQTDLPFGQFYLQELSVDGNYILDSKTKYPFSFSYGGQDIAIIKIQANEGQAVENILKRGEIKGLKVDEDGNALAGAVIGLFRSDCETFLAENALMTTKSIEDGSFSFKLIPCGDFIVREIEQPTGFVLSEELFPVTISENAQVIEIKITNEFIRGNLSLTKYDADFPDNKLSGTEFGVYRDTNNNQKLDESDELLGTMEETLTGVYEMMDVLYGGVLVKEKTAPEGFILDENAYYVMIDTDGKTYEIENEAGHGFINHAQKGSLKIVKTSSDGVKEGFEFRVEGPNGYDQTYTTDTGGELFIEGLRVGEYVITELKNDISEKYEIANPITVEIIADETLIVNVHNEKITVDIPKTGDASSIGVWIALLGVSSVCILAITIIGIKKRRKKTNK